MDEWNGLHGTDYKKGLIIKGAYFSRFLKTKGRTSDLRPIYTREKKWNKSEKDMVSTFL